MQTRVCVALGSSEGVLLIWVSDLLKTPSPSSSLPVISHGSRSHIFQVVRIVC